MRFASDAGPRYPILTGGFVIGHWESDAGLVFGGLQVLFTVLAFIAAAAAFKATWPQYRAWAAQPNIRLWLEMAEARNLVPAPLTAMPMFAQSSFILRVVVENTGRGTMRSATINIVVLPLCELTPLDPDKKTHYVSPLLSRNNEISGDGTERDVRFSVAREDITPGHHVFQSR